MRGSKGKKKIVSYVSMKFTIKYQTGYKIERNKYYLFIIIYYGQLENEFVRILS